MQGWKERMGLSSFPCIAVYHLPHYRPTHSPYSTIAQCSSPSTVRDGSGKTTQVELVGRVAAGSGAMR